MYVLFVFSAIFASSFISATPYSNTDHVELCKSKKGKKKSKKPTPAKPAISIESSYFQQDVPPWMENQIDGDLAYFQNKPISLKHLNYFAANHKNALLVKFSIIDNRLYMEKNWSIDYVDYRVAAYERNLRRLCQLAKFPNVVFLMTFHDASGFDSAEIPIFAMCKSTQDDRSILVPDFSSLNSDYQVLANKDITKEVPDWDNRKAQLIWRGSTAQSGFGMPFTEDTLDFFSRVTLCKLSQMYPDLINARFTIFAQGGEKIPSLQKFKGDWIPFEEQMNFKYQIQIDGNVASYSASGWKLFSNSLIFKTESPWIQWYSNELKPFVHYIPVRENLEDLLDQIKWARENDAEAKQIAKNARDFALTHITLSDDLRYLYYAICKYGQLTFVD